jgi:hypothetical protein
MRRVFAIAVIAEVCIVAILLNNEIKDFLFVHPWWQSFLAAIPGIAAPILAWFELQHSREANDLRIEANNHRMRANGLQDEQGKSVAKIAELQEKIANLTEELDTERNKHLQQIAANTQRPLSEAEINARILKKYVGQRAAVTEGENHWGAMGAVVAEVNENNILTLFVPAGYNSSQAWGQPVRCDKLHVVEVPKDGCAVQISIIERYGTNTTYGEARSWDERHVRPANARMQRGANVFNAQYRKDGSPKLRQIYVYAFADGSPNYIMVTMEDQQESNSWNGSKLDIEKKFAVLQIEWAEQGYRYNGGGRNGDLNLFTRK